MYFAYNMANLTKKTKNKMPGFLIVLPTYNEKENISIITADILKHQPKAHILIVDDNSPDGTAAVAKQLKNNDPRIDLIVREKKEGLAKAYIAGFKYALERDFDYIIEMDADLSHDPVYLKDFLHEIKNYDLVLGSRYINGGGIKNWGFLRKIISRCGCFYAKTILRLNINDLTGGFKCFRRETLKKINIDKIYSKGYCFQIELTYRTIQRNMNVKEIPIVFSERNHGISKMTKDIVLKAIINVWKIKFKNF